MEMIKSYAKINLGLNVVKKTRKNYHKLRMVMTRIELYDEIFFEKSDEVIVETDKKVCQMEENLCYKIAVFLKERYNISNGIKIHIKKNIPDGGGLGGGSSNAATVLKYLNKKWGLGLSLKKLKRIGFMFGCDIPFFVEGDISYVSGYGEKISKINAIKKEDDIILVIPNFKNSTKIIFENNKITDKGKRKITKLVKGLKTGDYISEIFNDLEESADCVTNGKISNIKNQLKNNGCDNVIMTGSGSTLVCFVDEKNDVNVLRDKIKKNLNDCQVIISKLKMY